MKALIVDQRRCKSGAGVGGAPVPSCEDWKCEMICKTCLKKKKNFLLKAVQPCIFLQTVISVNVSKVYNTSVPFHFFQYTVYWLSIKKKNILENKRLESAALVASLLSHAAWLWALHVSSSSSSSFQWVADEGEKASEGKFCKHSCGPRGSGGHRFTRPTSGLPSAEEVV